MCQKSPVVFSGFIKFLVSVAGAEASVVGDNTNNGVITLSFVIEKKFLFERGLCKDIGQTECVITENPDSTKIWKR